MKESGWVVEIAEMLWYVLVCLFTWHILQGIGWYPVMELSFWWMVVIGAVTFFVGGLLGDLFEDCLFDRRILKAGREVAQEMGIDPKTVKRKNIEIVEEDSEIVEVIIHLDKESKK